MTDSYFTKEKELEILKEIIPRLDNACKAHKIDIVDIIKNDMSISRKTCYLSEFLGTGSALNPAEVGYIIERYEKQDYTTRLLLLND